LFSLVNILGLSLGIAASLILFMYTSSEMSYDKFFPDYDRIYRVRCDNLAAGEYSERMARTNGPVGQAIRNEFPEVEQVVQLEKDNLQGLLSTDQVKYRIENGYFASENFFQVFSYPLIRGDKNTVLKEPGSIILSESLAKNFFGNEDPVGKEIKFNEKGRFKVTGVFKDIPENTHLKFDLLVSYITLTKLFAPYMESEWDSGESVYTYLKLKKGTDAAELEAKFPAMVERHMGSYLRAANHDKRYFLQPLSDIHLYSHFDAEAEANGDGRSVKFLGIIAFLIILIAWINYVNLSVSRSMERFKEIGIRMVAGAGKNQLKRQFMLEAILLNLVAVLLAVILAGVIYPYFSEFTGMKIQAGTWYNKTIWLSFALIVLTGALLSSVYPAFILTAVNPVQVLKGKYSAVHRKFSLNKLLLTFQFAISISLIIVTIVVHRQIAFMQNQDLGVDIRQTLVVHRPSVIDTSWFRKVESFKTDLKNQASVTEVSLSRYIPGEPINYSQAFKREGNENDKFSRVLYSDFFDEDYTHLYGLKFLAGRNFIKGKRDREMIINRKALKTLGIATPQAAIGQKIYNEGWKYTHTIVGVIEDYHQRTVKEDFLPMAYMHFTGPQLTSYFSIRTNTRNMKQTLLQVENIWNKTFPGNTFDYFFLDQQYNEQYKADVQFGRVFMLFSILAILIACVGLFALTLYTILRRSKEVAVRKVIGASVLDLLGILTREYFLLVGIAGVIAIPAMYWAMDGWLRNYANKIQLSWIFFILPVFILLAIVLISILFQVIKAVQTNPTKTLRTE
jgi:putative ABC transport system permease protein